MTTQVRKIDPATTSPSESLVDPRIGYRIKGIETIPDKLPNAAAGVYFDMIVDASTAFKPWDYLR